MFGGWLDGTVPFKVFVLCKRNIVMGFIPSRASLELCLKFSKPDFLLHFTRCTFGKNKIKPFLKNGKLKEL